MYSVEFVNCTKYGSKNIVEPLNCELSNNFPYLINTTNFNQFNISYNITEISKIDLTLKLTLYSNEKT